VGKEADDYFWVRDFSSNACHSQRFSECASPATHASLELSALFDRLTHILHKPRIPGKGGSHD
jgi:hypothetical protein